jgi:hypothetical protein
MITDPAKFTYETIDRLIELQNSDELVPTADSISQDYIDYIPLWKNEFDKFLGYIMDTYDTDTVIRIMNTILNTLQLKELDMHKISNFKKFHRDFAKIIVESRDKVQELYPKYTREEDK